MPLPLVPSRRTLLTVAVGAGLLAGAAPHPALAGGSTGAKPPKCDPAAAFCDNGRKNG